MNSPEIMEPSACTWCGIARREHGRQYADAVGWHAWAAPSDAQVLARMKARRLARTVAAQGALPVPAGAVPQPSEQESLDVEITADGWGGLQLWLRHARGGTYVGRYALRGTRGKDPSGNLGWQALDERDAAEVRALLDSVFPWSAEAERLRARVAESEAQREALVSRLQAGQQWQRGRSPELVSENFVSQSELRNIFGIPLTPPWGDGITRRIAPTQALREDEPAVPVCPVCQKPGCCCTCFGKTPRTDCPHQNVRGNEPAEAGERP